MRGCTGSHGVLQWSLSGVSGSMGSYKGIQYQVRGLAGSQGTDQWSLDGSMGPMMFSGATRGAIKAFGVLFIGLLMALEGPMVFSKATRGTVQNLWMLVNGLRVVLDGPRVEYSPL